MFIQECTHLGWSETVHGNGKFKFTLPKISMTYVTSCSCRHELGWTKWGWNSNHVYNCSIFPQQLLLSIGYSYHNNTQKYHNYNTTACPKFGCRETKLKGFPRWTFLFLLRSEMFTTTWLESVKYLRLIFTQFGTQTTQSPSFSPNMLGWTSVQCPVSLLIVFVTN